MDEIQFIVAKLNDAPFKKTLSLVDFDEKQSYELLQLLIDVFAVMDDAMACNVREVEREVLLPKVLNFLSILKFPLSEDERERETMANSLAEGEKHVIYPILHWALQRLPSLQKRAYLAKYLVPEAIPQEFMQDEVLVELHNSHKTLQAEFKEVHKAVDKLRQEPTRPGEVKQEVTTLEDERKQLSLKIERLKKQTSDEPGFAPLLEATSSLRHAQDEDARLNENRRRQIMTLQHVRARHEDAVRRLQGLKRNQAANASAEDMLAQLEEEVRELTNRVQGVMPRELEQQSERLQRLQEELFEPQRSKDDVEAMQGEVDGFERRIAQLSSEIDDQVSGRSDNKLAMFRQTAAVAQKKLAAKEDELERMEQALNRAKGEVESHEASLADAAGPKFMTRDEFKQYGATLREKTHVYKRMKQELGDTRAELVRLGRTEQILRSRDRNLGEFLEELEAKRGVVGYRDVVSKLQAASEASAHVDGAKEGALEEISNMVKQMNDALKERKAVLAPQIKKLREVRKEFEEVEAEYGRKKSTYDKVAVGLEVERQAIEAEADKAQADALQEESNYHYFQNLTSIAEAAVARVRNEEKWQQGQGHLLPNFRTYADLYKDKEARQKALKEQLQKQKASISTNEPEAMEQRKLFMDLSKLLAAKMQSKTAKLDNGDGSGGAFGAKEFAEGDAHVMRLG